MKISKWYLPILFLVFYLFPLNNRPLWMPDETRYAEISREMVANGDWVVPHFLNLRYFEKPIAGYWLNSISQILFGENNFAVRFASAISSGLSAYLIFFFAMRLWHCHRKAVFASFFYLSFFLVYGVGTFSVLDAMVTLWLNATMVCFYLTLTSQSINRKIGTYLLLGLVCGMGFLTKGFIALAVPVIAVVPYMIYQRRFGEILRFGSFAIFSASILIFPWALLIHQREPDYWHYFFFVEHIQRFIGNNAQHKAPFWYYCPVLLLGLIPWLGLIPGALKRGWKNTSQRAEYLYLAGWVILPFLFFSIAKGKLGTYILPCFAPLALLIALGLVDLFRENKSSCHLRLNVWVNSSFALMCVIIFVICIFCPSYAIYSSDDHERGIIGLVICVAWACLGFFQLLNIQHRWWLSAFGPLILFISIPWILPNNIINSKLPVIFIEQNKLILENASRILANDVGVASSVAWVLKRSQIDLFDGQGELSYGISYPDVHDRFIDKTHFAIWLMKARQEGRIALVLRTALDDNLKFTDLPQADIIIQRHWLTLLIYEQCCDKK